MKKSKSFFKSVYKRKFQEYSITAKDRFGVSFVHTAHSKKERDEIKAKWKEDLSKKLPPVIEHIPQKIQKKTVSRIDPIHYYYTDICEGEGLKYYIENFHAKMIDDDGVEYFMMVMKEGKPEYIDELPIARFFLMNKKQKDGLDFDDRYVNFWKSYRWNKGYYLVVVMPNIKFRNNQIGFYLRVNYGKEISYPEAKRIWTKIDSIGFERFEIAFDDIPKEKSRKRLAIDERSRRLQKEHLNKMNRQFRHVLKNDYAELEVEPKRHPHRMRIRVPKHYRLQRRMESANRKFGNPLDRQFIKERKEKELNQILNRSV